MTVINFSQSKIQSSVPFAIFLGACVVVGAFALMYFYNASVDLKFEVRAYEKNVNNAVARNADSKVQLHVLLAPEALDEVSTRYGLVKEVHPTYRGGVEVAVLR